MREPAFAERFESCLRRRVQRDWQDVRRRGNPAKPCVWRERAVEQMAQSRARTLAFIGQLPEGEVIRPRTHGKWSIKDTLAHIAAWEEAAVARLEQIMRGKAQEIVFYDDMRQANRFNARAVKHGKRIPLPVLLRGMEKVRARLVKHLLSLPVEELENHDHRYIVKEWLPEFAWTHEQSHLRRMRTKWRADQKKSRTQG